MNEAPCACVTTDRSHKGNPHPFFTAEARPGALHPSATRQVLQRLRITAICKRGAGEIKVKEYTCQAGHFGSEGARG